MGQRLRLDEIKARADEVHWTSTSIEQAMARMASSAADVPWLVSEVERLTRVIDAKPRQPLVVLNEYLDRAEKAETEVERLTVEAATQREWFEAADAAAERRLDQSIAWMERAEAAEAEVVTLRANWRHVTKSLGYGDGVTEPQIGHVEFVAECERQFSEASEWRESQRWRDECHDAGHPDDEDCYEHDPALVLVTLRARLAAVEALIGEADVTSEFLAASGDTHDAAMAGAVTAVTEQIRAALASSPTPSETGEGEHVAREVFTADGIPFVRCSCTNTKSPTSHRWLSEHVPNGGVAELQAVVKRQADQA